MIGINFKIGINKDTVQIINSGGAFAVIALEGKWDGQQVAGNMSFSPEITAAAVRFGREGQPREIRPYVKPLILFRFDVSTPPWAKDFTEYYSGEDEADAREDFEEDIFRYGFSKDEVEASIRPATAEEEAYFFN